MGLKPTKPVVTASVAMHALKRELGISAADMQRLFDAISSQDVSMGKMMVTLSTFKAEVPCSKPFFELGDIVSTRLFQVLGSEAGDGLNLDELICAIYLFTCSSTEQKYRLLFNMFDLNGGGFIRKKEFRLMSIEIVKGKHQCTSDTFDSDFKSLVKIMTDSGMQLYDVNGDGKLSFEEWCEYAKQDSAVSLCFEALNSNDAGKMVERIKTLNEEENVY